jgi:hypothetical protein
LLSINAKTSYKKIAYDVVKERKSKDHCNGNMAMSCEKLINKYGPMSVCSMVKLDKQFRYSLVNKGEDSDIWITQLDLCVRLKDMGSGILAIYDLCVA